MDAIASNDYYTGVFIEIEILNSKEGAIRISSDWYLQGQFGYQSPVALRINGSDYPLDKTWQYGDGNKGKIIHILVYFPRIPAGTDRVSLVAPHSFSWEDMMVPNNPDMVEHTSWDEISLRNYWAENPITSIEGIYYFNGTKDRKWWGENKHTLAIKKNDYQYDIIYLKGSNKAVWKEGDLKGSFVATAIPNLYKALSWYMENKVDNPDFYLKFSEGHMMIYEENDNVTSDFLKLFPAKDINLTGDSELKTGATTDQSKGNVQSSGSVSGSGIFIAPKICVTNYHVIENASKIEISVKNGREVLSLTAKVLATDKTNDLALLQIEDKDFKGISPIPYNLSNRIVDTGTSVFTMGFPIADYMGEEVKVTDGLISSKTGYQGDIVTYQISAPIQPGSSGGPLFDKHGNLIGITNAGLKGGQNVGYAIKSSYLYNLIESAPIKIDIPSDTSLKSSDLPSQIKTLSQCVVFIKSTR